MDILDLSRKLLNPQLVSQWPCLTADLLNPTTHNLKNELGMRKNSPTNELIKTKKQDYIIRSLVIQHFLSKRIKFAEIP